MNMAFLASREHLTDSTWTISFDEDVSLGTYVKVSGGHYEHQHTFSYFHRAIRVITTSPADTPVDLVLASSVGDYCTPKLAWKVVDNFINELLASRDHTRLEHLVTSFTRHFPTYDLVYNNDVYSHRALELTPQDGELARGVLGLKGSNTSGNHMLLSPRLIKALPYCYFGPGRIADARFFLMIQNDPKWKSATESSLCVSHTKKADCDDHELFRELSTHMHDEYAYMGFNYALFFLVYVDSFDFSDWSFVFDHDKTTLLRNNIIRSLTQKLPFSLPEEEKTIICYQKAFHGLSLIKSKALFSAEISSSLDPIIATLEMTEKMLVALKEECREIMISGIDLFFETAQRFALWQRSINTHLSHEPVS
jgi:hypothetical protein